MKALYSILMMFAKLILPLVAIFSAKIKRWYQAQLHYKSSFTHKIDSKQTYIWVHCASSGEFEQALPIMQELKKQRSELKFAVSFFSTSGYIFYKASNHADMFFYFPLDTKQNIHDLLQLLRPVASIFVRSEFWLNTLLVLKEREIPIFLVNANRIDSSFTFRNFYYSYCVRYFNAIFYTDEYGNTKWEKAIQNSQKNFESSVLYDFIKERFCVFIGSSWRMEEHFVKLFLERNKENDKICFVIAPHEWDLTRLQSNFDFNKVQFYSNCNTQSKGSLLFIDTKGILKYVYRYADLALIGGGFDKTLHNALEAVVYKIPVLIGPNHQKFEEIQDLKNKKLLIEINTYKEFEDAVFEFADSNKKQKRLSFEIEQELKAHYTTSNKIAKKIIDNIAYTE